MPTIPFITKKSNTSPFYGPDDDIPVLVTILMGLQRKYYSFHSSPAACNY